MKNVGLLISELNSGGAERVVSRLSGILNNEFNICVIVFENNQTSYEINGKLINMNINSSSNLIIKTINFINRAIKLNRIKKDENLDIVISFLDTPNILNILTRNRRCKTIVSIRNYTEFEYNDDIFGSLVKNILKYLYKKANAIIPVSKVIAEYYVNHLNINRDKVKVIYNPFDIDEIHRLSLEEVEEDLNLLEVNFVSVGRLMKQKGYEHLIKAFKEVNILYPKTTLTIIGKDYYNNYLHKLVDSLNLNQNVRLLGYRSNPFKYISKFEVYVLSSLYEGFPNSLVEAMICKCAIISTDCKSGPREILINKPNLNKSITNFELVDYGILVNPIMEEKNSSIFNLSISERNLVNAMITFVENPNLIDRYSHLSFERAKDFSYERCKNEFIELIERICNEK